MSVTPFRPGKRRIMQRCVKSDNPNWADIERLAARLRTIFPAHEFVIQ